MDHHPPIAIRTIAAMFAVFMTIATLNSMISIAEPQHSQLMAQTAARDAAHAASAAARGLVVVATKPSAASVN